MIKWFAENDVAANLLLVFLVAFGLFSLTNILPTEVFPTTEREAINISVTQRGATPSDIESGITERIEAAIADYAEIDEITSTSTENRSSVRASLYTGTDKQKALNEIKSRVDALSTLPTSAERPTISVSEFSRDVINLVIYGDIDEKELNLLSRQIEDEILRVPGISQTSIEGIRPFEISINISEQKLREYNISVNDISVAIRRQSLDLSAGQVRTKSGDILLSTKSQAYTYDDYAELPIFNYPDGSSLKLGDIATIDDGFDENTILTRYNGKRAARLSISRIGKENAIEVAEKVRKFRADYEPRLPETVKLAIWDDDSEIIRDRINTLLKSAWQGLILVFILLALMLRTSVAIWVTVGIPVCFAGALAVMPWVGATINIFSVFGFIIVLGVVVDDAIVTGENIYTHFTRHGDGLRAAIEGTEEVSKPVVFGVLTTIAAFTPFLLITEGFAAFARSMAVVVVCCLVFSLIESKLILPSHLKHMKNSDEREGASNPILLKFRHIQDAVGHGMMSFAYNTYRPFLIKVVRNRYLTLTVFIAMTVLTVFMFRTGMISYTFFPRVAGTTANATLTMAEGTPYEVTEKAVSTLDQAAIKTVAKYTNEDTGETSVKGILSTVGSQGGGGRRSSGSGNRARVQVELDTTNSAPVPMSAADFVKDWRTAAGSIMGVESLTYRSERFRIADPVSVQLTGTDGEELDKVVAAIENKLKTFDGVFDIGNSLSNGKRELNIALKPQGELLGLNLQNITTQVRSAFFGSEAQRIQRQRDDIRVMVKYPVNERSDLSKLDDLMIKTGSNIEARFSDIATVSWTRSPSSIRRIDQRRAVNVTADLDKTAVDEKQLNQELNTYIANLLASYPQISYSMEGEQRAQRDSNTEMLYSTLFIILVIYTLLAIPFKSYSQPLVVIMVMPFSLIGCILGHVIMGIGMSIFSFWGVLALFGILVNDSLVMVDWVNRRVNSGMDKFQAIIEAGASRFRPIILTSVTTFVGVFPILFDDSDQGRFLAPMAISLGFGILFATFITLLMVPCNYLILEDIKRLFKRDSEDINESYEPLTNDLKHEI